MVLWWQTHLCLFMSDWAKIYKHNNWRWMPMVSVHPSLFATLLSMQLLMLFFRSEFFLIVINFQWCKQQGNFFLPVTLVQTYVQTLTLTEKPNEKLVLDYNDAKSSVVEISVMFNSGLQKKCFIFKHCNTHLSLF